MRGKKTLAESLVAFIFVSGPASAAIESSVPEAGGIVLLAIGILGLGLSRYHWVKRQVEKK